MNNLPFPDAVQHLTENFKSDPHFAETWHDNLAMVMQDHDMDYTDSQSAATSFMILAFGIDTKAPSERRTG